MTHSGQKILITGATGFIGEALCNALMGRSLEVKILMRSRANANKIPKKLRASIVLGSLDDTVNLDAACVGVDQIIHLAGMAHVGGPKSNELYNTNVKGTKNLLRSALKEGVRRFIFLSSALAVAAEFGIGDITDYGKSKLKAEKLLQEAAKDHKIEVLILRSVNVYGPGMKGNIARMIELIDRGLLPPLPKTHNQISLISSEDVALALIAGLASDSVTSDPMIITDGVEYSIEGIEAAIYSNLRRTKASWRIPHMILYAASATAGLISAIIGKGSISLRTYRNLISDNLFPNDDACRFLKFQPSRTFYQSLPEITQSIRHDNLHNIKTER